ncbi:MAG: site-specific integrase [Candidatus Methanomethylophilaceae archaeon]|nr:site-specific integrase [Candidatus Methanomethylophilaceae archaeon]
MAHGLGVKESTRRVYVSDFAQYYRWAAGFDVVAQARILWNPPQISRRVWIGREDYRRMMEAAKPRERLVLALGATMGLRRAEMCALSLDDLKDGYIIIHGKGHGDEGKVAEKIMSGPVRRELESYLKVRKPSPDGRLLTSMRGGGLDPKTLYWNLRRLGESVGVRMSPHALRRLYAMTLADEGVPLETIARMMRHESPVTTMQCYLRADPRRIAEAQAKVDAVLAVRYIHTAKSYISGISLSRRRRVREVHPIKQHWLAGKRHSAGPNNA